MSGLVILVLVGVWFWLGYLIWRITLARTLKSASARIALGLALAVAWLVAPWADEWLGASEFERLCNEMPKVKFHGPVSMGPGSFYNQDGSPKWKTRAEFDAIRNGGEVYVTDRGNVNRWDQLFIYKTVSERIADRPIPVLQEKTIYLYVPTGQVVLESYWRGSPGGWVKRLIGWGAHAPYQCGHKDKWPQDWEWIQF